jgi:hypothetical protein
MTGERPALLGRGPGGAVRAAALLLPGGSIDSRRPPLRIADLGLQLPRLALRDRGAPLGLAVHLLRYRYRGWNGGDADTGADTSWALGVLAERYPGAPVVLVGNSLGGRAAVAAADHPAVTGVAGIAPWLPAAQRVESLAGRPLLIVHGAADRSEAPAADSLDFARRARAAGVVTARFLVPGAGHYLLRRGRDWSALVAAFTLAAAGLAPMPALIRRAADPGADLSMPLPSAGTLGS